MDSNLMGFLRKSKAGNALKLAISAEAFQKAETYTTNKGDQFVGLVVSLGKVQDIIAGGCYTLVRIYRSAKLSQ